MDSPRAPRTFFLEHATFPSLSKDLSPLTGSARPLDRQDHVAAAAGARQRRQVGSGRCARSASHHLHERGGGFICEHLMAETPDSVLAVDVYCDKIRHLVDPPRPTSWGASPSTASTSRTSAASRGSPRWPIWCAPSHLPSLGRSHSSSNGSPSRHLFLVDLGCCLRLVSSPREQQMATRKVARPNHGHVAATSCFLRPSLWALSDSFIIS